MSAPVAHAPRGPGAGGRTWPALVGVIVLLGAANVLRSTVVPGQAHFGFNVALGLAVTGVAWWASMSAAELGLARSTVADGLRWGVGAFLAISMVVVLAGAVPATRDVLSDGRADVSTAAMLLRALVVIPLGTVLVEELAFRGVLLGLLDRVTSSGRALVTSAVLFGLWHLLPVWRGGGAGDLADADGAGRVGAVAVTFAATFAAGLAFGWLRRRSGSLLAPMAAHLATNSVVFAVAWAAAG